jgi:hypothetical protein
MKIKGSILRAAANLLYAAADKLAPSVYAEDGLISVHNHDFMLDPHYKRAYARGLQALHGFDDYRWHWRIHVGLWVASSASTLEGDFVECGVNRGFLSSAIMEYLSWDSLNKTFYLLDTFAGLADRFVSARELQNGAMEKNQENLRRGFYVSGADEVEANFRQWTNAKVIKGAVPESLPQVRSEKIAYLHLDMNCAPPEAAAASHFWNRLVPGGFILMDDYAYFGCGIQKSALDEFAFEKGVRICALPTGQGLLVKTR